MMPFGALWTLGEVAAPLICSKRGGRIERGSFARLKMPGHSFLRASKRTLSLPCTQGRTHPADDGENCAAGVHPAFEDGHRSTEVPLQVIAKVLVELVFELLGVPEKQNAVLTSTVSKGRGPSERSGIRANH
jgi:hypothetical protein